MKVVFRCDASLQMGNGHVMRCLTLADTLSKQGADCSFLCRAHEGNLIEFIQGRGYAVTALPYQDRAACPVVDEPVLAHQDWLGTTWVIDAEDSLKAIGAKAVDWIIVDHYSLDQRWEKRVGSACDSMMVIDDLADRQHDCALLLDQNFQRLSGDYDGLVGTDTIKLCGAQYALLQPRFAELRAYSLARREKPKLQHLLISMGGVDKDNATGKVLEALGQFDLKAADIELTIVMGLNDPWFGQVQEQASCLPLKSRVQVNVANMAELMADADLAIGAAGSTSWERCCLGVPSIQVVLADNQTRIAQALSDSNAALMADVDNLVEVLSVVFGDDGVQRGILKKLSHCAAAVTDGRGVFLVADYLGTR